MWQISTFRQIATFLAAALVAVPSLVSAEDLDAMSCRNGGFAGHETFQTAKIIGEGRAFLLDDMNGCPEAESCRQAGSPYLVSGDTVLVSRLRLDHACVYFPNKVGGSAGYVPLSRLQITGHDTVATAEKWLGKWSNYNNPAIAITRRNDGFHVTGDAFWPGRPGTHDYPSTNIGELNGRLRIFGNRARYNDGYCIVNFFLIGDFLIASDNFQCGGMNVRFRDVMTRAD